MSPRPNKTEDVTGRYKILGSINLGAINIMIGVISFLGFYVHLSFHHVLFVFNLIKLSSKLMQKLLIRTSKTGIGVADK